MKYTIYCCTLFISVIGVSVAPTAAQDEGISISGEHRAIMPVPASDRYFDYNGELKMPRIENDIDLKVQHSEVTLRAGLRLKTRLVKTPTQTDRFVVYPLENNVTLEHGPLRASLGYQYYSWGTADKLNPTDNINPRDYTTGTDADKLSIFSASVQYYVSDRFSLQGVYVPFEEPDLFPVDVAAKLSPALFRRVRMSSLSVKQSGVLPSFETVDGTATVRISDPGYDPSSFLAGGRARFTGNTFDISLSYLYDMDPYYTPRLTFMPYTPVDAATVIDAAIPAEVLTRLPSQFWALDSIELYRERIHRIGFDMKTTLDRFGLWAEGCYSLTTDTDNSSWKHRNHFFEWTLGLDFFWGADDQHYINIQQIGHVVVNYDQDFLHDYPEGQPAHLQLADKSAMEEYYYRLLTNRLSYTSEEVLCGAAIRSEWSLLNGDIKPAIEGVYLYPYGYDDSRGTRLGDLIGKAAFTWNPADAVAFELGAQGYYALFRPKGKNTIENIDENRIGLFFPQSRVYFITVFNWSR